MTTHLHGVPLREWIGRQVKLNSRDAPGNARNPAKITAVNERAGTATVHPGGHRGTEEIPLDRIHPWWSRNDDLREKYHRKGHNAEFFHEALDDCLDVILKKPTVHEEIFPPPLPEDVPDAPIQPKLNEIPESVPHGPLSDGGTAVKAQPALCHHQARPEDRKKQAVTRTIKQIVINPNASTTWMDDYKALQEAMNTVKAREDAVTEAQASLEHAKETVETFIAALDGVGVTIEWDEPEHPLKVALQSNTPGRKVPSEAEIPEIDLMRVRRYRTSLINQMVPGRSYNREQIVSFVNEPDNATTKKIITYTFRNHPKLTFIRGGGGTPGVYQLKA